MNVKDEAESRIKPEWVKDEWVIAADTDLSRLEAMREMLVSLGFVRDQILFAYTGAEGLALIKEKNASILFLDDSIGVDSSKELHALLSKSFGPHGYFFFAITEGKERDFVQFSASARIDGIIFRPFRDVEFKLRISEVFAVKWQNRIVGPGSDGSNVILIRGKDDPEHFKKAIEKENRLGKRDPFTPDPKMTPGIGLSPVQSSAIKAGKRSFDKVRLSFKAVARNGVVLEKAFFIHALEMDEMHATFECAAESWEDGDNISIEAEIIHGEEKYLMRIEAKVSGDAAMGLVTVTFDEGNRTRFDAAMKMVAKRFKELKEFFKYAKGA